MSIAHRITHSFSESEITKKWYLVDAEGKTLGRIASNVARILYGKHKPQFSPNADTGDFVIVINAEKIKVTGKRAQLKTYFHYTGYPGGATIEEYKHLIKTNPEKIFMSAVKGMIPHNRLGAQIIKKLKVYKGTEHPHQAQQPETLNF